MVTLIFDEKVLIVVLGVLVVGVIAKFSIPYHLQAQVSFDFILFFVGGFALMIYFHLVGFIEGYNKGYNEGVKYGKTEMH